MPRTRMSLREDSSSSQNNCASRADNQLIEDNVAKSKSAVTTSRTTRSSAILDFVEGEEGSTQDMEVERFVKDKEFPRWLGQFKSGFNVMLYGYGSKLDILEEFKNLVNDQHLVVTINGMFPKLTPRKLLIGLCEFVAPDQPAPHGHFIETLARESVAILSSIVNAEDVYILINNFDNMALKSKQMLSTICHLVQIPFIHVLATSDTVNAPLGLDQSEALQLRFCWVHCPTFKQSGEELNWIPGINGDETKTVTQKSSLKYVLQSLTGNARKAFALLGEMQLKQMKSHSAKKSKDVYDGVKFQELAKECREKFIAHSDDNLRMLLVEFFDHKLIRQAGKGRNNNLLVDLSLEALEDAMSLDLA